MSRWNKKAYISQKIRSHYLGKLKSASIKENRNVYCPRIPDCSGGSEIKTNPIQHLQNALRYQIAPGGARSKQIQFSTYKTPYGWTISPTLAGKKVQQVLMNA